VKVCEAAGGMRRCVSLRVHRAGAPEVGIRQGGCAQPR
jgi:hypothetical protein